ncbi:hypothetical protein Scep_030967 [Stephania cephalantha]|uniref:Uncharacterized protein n=1 Tax=Stephania cephalantha TaxID=152367 RepID=A0AAP0HHF9_9MAGN
MASEGATERRRRGRVNRNQGATESARAVVYGMTAMKGGGLGHHGGRKSSVERDTMEGRRRRAGWVKDVILECIRSAEKEERGACGGTGVRNSGSGTWREQRQRRKEQRGGNGVSGGGRSPCVGGGGRPA